MSSFLRMSSTSKRTGFSSSIDITLALTIFSSTLLVYSWTLCPTVAGGDSGELVVAACTMGIPHPPGYPLHTMLGYLFFCFLPTGSPAARVNYLSSICSAIASTLIYMTSVMLSSWLLIDDECLLNKDENQHMSGLMATSDVAIECPSCADSAGSCASDWCDLSDTDSIKRNRQKTSQRGPARDDFGGSRINRTRRWIPAQT
jgi:hypothetical protein